ncbi:MAG: hypothetical protein AB7U82_27880 [Blastocatellales bacterium]
MSINFSIATCGVDWLCGVRHVWRCRFRPDHLRLERRQVVQMVSEWYDRRDGRFYYWGNCLNACRRRHLIMSLPDPRRCAGLLTERRY